LFFYLGHSGDTSFDGFGCVSGLDAAEDRGVVYAKGGN
jgi:hypothetical protein